MSGTSVQIEKLYLHVGDKQYELHPAPLKVLRRIWTTLPKLSALAGRMQEMITEAGGEAGRVSDTGFMEVHSQRIDLLVAVLCEAAGIPVAEAEEHMTKDQVEELAPLFDNYLWLSGFNKEDPRPNGVAGPVLTGPINSTETGTPSRPN